MTSPSLFDPPPPPFGGSTYDPSRDGGRLRRQLDAVFALMGDGRWRTLYEISAALAAVDVTTPEQSVSARLRDLRKEKFGGYTVEHRRRAGASAGTWEYRVVGEGGASC